jgi:transposase
VDLEKRRILQLLAERSVETSTAWLRTHPEIDLVSRDRGKIFREAATDGAPQAKQVVDRFHATRRILLKPWRSSFASRNARLKRQYKVAQAKRVLLRGRQYLKKSHKSDKRVIANK